CDQNGECEDVGSCDSQTGACSYPPLPDGSACSDDQNPCTADQCLQGACDHGAGNSGTVCRAASLACDVAEQCTGTDTTCPVDIFVSGGTTCRPSAGGCDVPEACGGSGPDCPSDGFVSFGTVCRGASGFCDLPEACGGSNP